MSDAITWHLALGGQFNDWNILTSKITNFAKPISAIPEIHKMFDGEFEVRSDFLYISNTSGKVWHKGLFDIKDDRGLF